MINAAIEAGAPSDYLEKLKKFGEIS